MPRAHLAVLLTAVGIVLTGCGSSGPAADGASAADSTTTAPPTSTSAVFTDTRFGFNFSYPRDWLTGDFTYAADQTAGVAPAASTAIGLDQDNSVLLTRYNLANAVTTQNLPEQVGELDGVITRFSGRPAMGEATQVGGLPAVRYQAFSLPNDAAKRSSRVVFLFEGSAQYELNCQSTPEGRDKIDQGCDQMLATLRRN